MVNPTLVFLCSVAGLIGLILFGYFKENKTFADGVIICVVGVACLGGVTVAFPGTAKLSVGKYLVATGGYAVALYVFMAIFHVMNIDIRKEAESGFTKLKTVLESDHTKGSPIEEFFGLHKPKSEPPSFMEWLKKMPKR